MKTLMMEPCNLFFAVALFGAEMDQILLAQCSSTEVTAPANLQFSSVIKISLTVTWDYS